jgi:hypothetical protein
MFILLEIDRCSWERHLWTSDINYVLTESRPEATCKPVPRSLAILRVTMELALLRFFLSSELS